MFKTMVRALLCALAIGGSCLANAAQPIVIKFSHVVAENTPKGQGALLRAFCCSGVFFPGGLWYTVED